VINSEDLDRKKNRDTALTPPLETASIIPVHTRDRIRVTGCSAGMRDGALRTLMEVDKSQRHRRQRAAGAEYPQLRRLADVKAEICGLRVILFIYALCGVPCQISAHVNVSFLIYQTNTIISFQSNALRSVYMRTNVLQVCGFWFDGSIFTCDQISRFSVTAECARSDIAINNR